MSASRSKRKRTSPKLEADYERLNPRQTIFVNELLADVGMSACEAARRAGYSSPEVSAKQLMRHPVINKLISIRQNERLERLDIKADDVLQYLYHALYHDPLETFVIHGDGTLAMKTLEQIPLPIRRLLTKIKTKTREDRWGDKETTIEVEWVSKELALQLCMKHFGLLQENVTLKHTVGDDLLTKIREAMDGAQTHVLTDQVIEGRVLSN